MSPTNTRIFVLLQCLANVAVWNGLVAKTIPFYCITCLKTCKMFDETMTAWWDLLQTRKTCFSCRTGFLGPVNVMFYWFFLLLHLLYCLYCILFLGYLAPSILCCPNYKMCLQHFCFISILLLQFCDLVPSVVTFAPSIECCPNYKLFLQPFCFISNVLCLLTSAYAVILQLGPPQQQEHQKLWPSVDRLL